METIYKKHYTTETLEEMTDLLAVGMNEIERLLLSHPFFLAQPQERVEIFSNLVMAGNRVAALDDAEIEILIDPEEPSATVVLSAPCFVFQGPELALWQKICLFSSEITFTSEGTILLFFDFSQEIATLFQRFKAED